MYTEGEKRGAVAIASAHSACSVAPPPRRLTASRRYLSRLFLATYLFLRKSLGNLLTEMKMMTLFCDTNKTVQYNRMTRLNGKTE